MREEGGKERNSINHLSVIWSVNQEKANGCEVVTTAEAVKDAACGTQGYQGPGQDLSLAWLLLTGH